LGRKTITQRMFNIYIHLAYRLDSTLQAEGEKHAQELEKKESFLTLLKEETDKKEQAFITLQEAYNNAMTDKQELENSVNQLSDMVESQKSTIMLLQEKNNNLADLVAAYQEHEKDYQNALKSIQSVEKEFTQSNSERKRCSNRL
jgi:chromosome segregation ATPase